METSIVRQGSLDSLLFTNDTTTANATAQQSISGFSGHVLLEVVNTGTGTCSLDILGGFDFSVVAAGYRPAFQRVDNALPAARTPSQSTFAVAASSAAVLQILDIYGVLQVKKTAATSGIALTVRVYGVPVQ
jgi:hypothetical protein